MGIDMEALRRMRIARAQVDLFSHMHLGQRTAAPESEESYRRVHDDHEHVCFRTQALCDSHATCL